MRDYEKLCNSIYWELFDADLNPEDVYDVEAMCADDGPTVFLRDLMHANIRFPERDDENSANILREICMQEGIKVYGFSYDDIISDIMRIYFKAKYILDRVN